MDDPDPLVEFISVINDSLGVIPVLVQGKNFVVGEVLPGIFHVVTDGSDEALGQVVHWFKDQYPADRFQVLRTVELVEPGKWLTTLVRQNEGEL